MFKREGLAGCFIFLDCGDGVGCLTVCPLCLRNILTEEDALHIVRISLEIDRPPNGRRVLNYNKVDRFFGRKRLCWTITRFYFTRIKMGRRKRIETHKCFVFALICRACIRICEKKN